MQWRQTSVHQLLSLPILYFWYVPTDDPEKLTLIDTLQRMIIKQLAKKRVPSLVWAWRWGPWGHCLWTGIVERSLGVLCLYGDTVTPGLIMTQWFGRLERLCITFLIMMYSRPSVAVRFKNGWTRVTCHDAQSILTYYHVRFTASDH